MKNTFNVLFYTGISIMVSILLIIGLFAMNLQNIFNAFIKNQADVSSYVKDSSAYVIKDNNESKVTPNQSIIKVETQKAKIIKPVEVEIPPIDDFQLTPLVKDTVEKAKFVISPDSVR